MSRVASCSLALFCRILVVGGVLMKKENYDNPELEEFEELGEDFEEYDDSEEIEESEIDIAAREKEINKKIKRCRIITLVITLVLFLPTLVSGILLQFGVITPDMVIGPFYMTGMAEGENVAGWHFIVIALSGFFVSFVCFLGKCERKIKCGKPIIQDAIAMIIVAVIVGGGSLVWSIANGGF